MKLDANAYRLNVPHIKMWRERLPDEPQNDAIGAMAVAYSVPIIVLCHYIGELEGYTPDLKSFISRLMNFYGVTSVLNTSVEIN